MNLSPLKLTSYFCSDISFSANREYDPSKPVELKIEEYSCNHKVESIAGKERTYQVSVRLKHQTSKKSNGPCSFSIEVIGFFEIAAEFQQEKADRAVRVNAPSVLYGIAREVVRSITSLGPFTAVIVPTLSFVEETGSVSSVSLPENRVAKALESQGTQ